MRMQIELLRSAGIGDRSSLAMPAVALEQSREQGTSLPETRSVPPHDQPIKTVDSNGPVSDTNAVSHGPHRPVRQTLNLAGNYSEPQKRHVEDLVRRYNAKTQRSKSYATRSRATLADNRAVLGFRMGTKELIYPVVAEHSAGSRFWDLDGNEYIDFTCGFGVHLFGHRPRLVVEAIEKQSKQGFHLGPQSNLAGPAAALFCEVTGMDRAAFCTTGSEAVMTAIRIARAFTGRDRVVMFQGAYHGNFDGVLARNVGGHLDPKSRPVAPGVPQKVIDDVVVLPYGEPFAVAWLKANAASVAAVLVDPVQVWRPEFRPVQFLHDVRDATRQNGIVLIFDEMISGLRLILGKRGSGRNRNSKSAPAMKKPAPPRSRSPLTQLTTSPTTCIAMIRAACLHPQRRRRKMTGFELLPIIRRRYIVGGGCIVDCGRALRRFALWPRHA
jgi:hypothetical protein